MSAMPTDTLVSMLRQRGQAFTYSVRWGSNGTTANIAQNGNSESSVVIDSAFNFIVDDFTFGAYSSAVGLSYSRNQEAAGTAPSMGGLRLKMRDTRGPWSTEAGDDGIGADLITGNGANVNYPLTKYFIAAGDTFYCKLFNFTATTVFYAQLVLRGVRVPVGR